ncbi:glycosyl hydrolase catalytic core-domain-containing protein [Trametes gibbosa]|nr:glycosyl hydrolase catalytic core-domain-containing protein [Trametes gibbosa]
MTRLSPTSIAILTCAIAAVCAIASPTIQTGDVAVRARANPAFGQRGSKICLPWGEGNDASLADFKTSHVVGLYTWGVSKPANANSDGFDFWPMLWGGDSARISDFENAVATGFGTIILGFNEPNEPGQSNLDPVTAAALWRAHIEPKKALGYKLASPAVSHNPNGRTWMQQFIQACGGCTIDYMALHWYDIGIDSLTDYITQFHNQFGLPILITEFAEQNLNGGAQPTSAEVLAFTKQAISFFDATDYILAACPFGFVPALKGSSTPNALQNADGTPNALGSLLINDGQ